MSASVWLLRTALACVPLLALTSCGDESTAQDVPALQQIDERAGTVAGVGIGASKARVEARLGRYQRPATAYPTAPTDRNEEQTAGPWSVVTGPHHLGPGGKRGEQVTLRYKGAALFVFRDRVFGFMISAGNARTGRGVQVGDGLDAAKKAYPTVRCEGSSSSDTSATQAASCAGFLRKNRWIYFGGDPIRSITLMERGIDDYSY
jgi:hypothetical protein